MMNKWIRAALVVVTVSMPSMALATNVYDAIISQLRTQGYTQFVVQKTFLGRIRILSSKGSLKREVIVHPFTGEILRDSNGRNELHERESDRDENTGSGGLSDDGISGGGNGDNGDNGDNGGDNHDNEGGGDDGHDDEEDGHDD